MSRYEFIEKLRAALMGKATQSAINENIRYYEEYLDIEIRKGKSEEEVIKALGDPRLLAKTIIEANKQTTRGSEFEEVYNDTVDYSGRKEHKQYGASKWGIIVTLILIVVVILALVGAVLRLILPIVVPVILISMAVKIISVLANRD